MKDKMRKMKTEDDKGRDHSTLSKKSSGYAALNGTNSFL